MDTTGGDPTYDDPQEQLLDQAEEALDQGDADMALELCRKVLSADPRHPGALFVAADAERALGDLDRAEAGYRAVTYVAPEHSPAWSALAAVLFDMLRFEEARIASLRALRADPLNAEAAWIRGMLRERRGDLRGADRDFLRATRHEPETYAPPQTLTDAMLAAVVDEAKRTLHPTIQTYLDQVTFVVEDVPSEELCREFDPPAFPGEVLGFFSGGSEEWAQLPPTITLFRRNLERFAYDRDNLIDELRITVFHEVGHFLGLDEEDLEARGLD